MDGNTYNINDFEKARQDAIANRQKKQWENVWDINTTCIMYTIK